MVRQQAKGQSHQPFTRLSDEREDRRYARNSIERKAYRKLEKSCASIVDSRRNNHCRSFIMLSLQYRQALVSVCARRLLHKKTFSTLGRQSKLSQQTVLPLLGRSGDLIMKLGPESTRRSNFSYGSTHTIGSFRYFSSPPTSGKPQETNEEPDEAASSSFLGRILTPQTQTYLMVGGGALGTLIVGRTVLSFTSFFTHLTPMTMAKVGFYMGFGTATVMAGLAAFTYDTITIRADPVFYYGLSKVQNSPECQAALGSGISPGKLRTYRLDAGRFEATSATRFQYRPPRIQMLFDVQALEPPYRTGLVTLEAHKSTGSFPPKLTTTVLKVDYETGSGDALQDNQTLWLVGDEDQYQRVSKRSGIRLSELGQFMHINKAVRK